MKISAISSGYKKTQYSTNTQTFVGRRLDKEDLKYLQGLTSYMREYTQVIYAGNTPVKVGFLTNLPCVEGTKITGHLGHIPGSKSASLTYGAEDYIGNRRTELEVNLETGNIKVIKKPWWMLRIKSIAARIIRDVGGNVRTNNGVEPNTYANIAPGPLN